MPTRDEVNAFSDDLAFYKKPLTASKFIATAMRSRRSGLVYANMMAQWPVPNSRLDPERQSPYVNETTPPEWRGMVEKRTPSVSKLLRPGMPPKMTVRGQSTLGGS